MARPALVLGVPLMDEDHAHLEKQFRKVAATADEGLPALLVELAKETRAHFEREEHLMRAAQVPVYPCHVAQHDVILASLADGHRCAKAGDLAGLRHFLADTLPGLVADHIATVDLVTAGFLKNQAVPEVPGL